VLPAGTGVEEEGGERFIKDLKQQVNSLSRGGGGKRRRRRRRRRRSFICD